MKRRTVFLSAFAALALIALLALSAGGCSRGSASKTGQVTLTPPGTLPITRDSGATLEAFMVHYQQQTMDLETNTFLIEFQKATNVKLNLVIAEIESASERLNLLLNSGQYPEVIIHDISGTDLMRYGAGEKIFIPLDNLIEEQGVNIKAYFAKYPWMRESMTSRDGNLYGIPVVEAHSPTTVNHGIVSYKLWYNTAWLQKLGLSKPTTTEEFRAMLRAFKTRDPNGNGKADEIPLTGAYGTWAAQPYLFLLNAFGYYDESFRVLRNDTFTPTANQDYIRDGLAYVKSLYDEGLIDPASLTQTELQMAALGNNPGDVIMGAASCGHLGMAVDVNTVERAKVYTTLEPLLGPNGYRGIPVGSREQRPTNGKFMITDKCKNPALALRFADAYCDNFDWAIRGQVGIKGIHWTDPDPGSFGFDGVTPARIKRLSIENGSSAGNDLIQGSFRLLEGNWKGEIQLVGDITDPGNYESRLMQETIKFLPYAADAQPVPNIPYAEDAANRRGQISAALSDYVKNSIAEFITGQRNLNTDWNAYKQELERLGYSEYIKIEQDAYNAYLRK